MRLSELSKGYGKFQYKREGLTEVVAYSCVKQDCIVEVELSLPLVRLITTDKKRAIYVGNVGS